LVAWTHRVNETTAGFIWWWYDVMQIAVQFTNLRFNTWIKSRSYGDHQGTVGHCAEKKLLFKWIRYNY